MVIEAVRIVNHTRKEWIGNFCASTICYPCTLSHMKWTNDNVEILNCNVSIKYKNRYTKVEKPKAILTPYCAINHSKKEYFISRKPIFICNIRMNVYYSFGWNINDVVVLTCKERKCYIVYGENIMFSGKLLNNIPLWDKNQYKRVYNDANEYTGYRQLFFNPPIFEKIPPNRDVIFI